jgi:hypothetical protein
MLLKRLKIKNKRQNAIKKLEEYLRNREIM